MVFGDHHNKHMYVYSTFARPRSENVEVSIQTLDTDMDKNVNAH